MPSTPARTTRRADARENEQRILDAAVTCLSRDVDASVSRIAQAAGVGRVTLYGHFPSRDVLVEAALVRALRDGARVLEGLDLTGDPRAALRTLITSSWTLMTRSAALLEAAAAALPPGRVQELHAGPAERVEELVRRGQAEGVFRSDLPARWLTGVLHRVMKGAGLDVAAGRLDADEAAHLIAETMLGACGARPDPPTGR